VGEMTDDDIELGHDACPQCQHHTYFRRCNCEEGYSDHDCGDDCCLCFLPEPNVRCSECGGHGAHNWCPNCGWDLLLKRYINGRDERPESPFPLKHE
jgi:hypothetical protein